MFEFESFQLSSLPALILIRVTAILTLAWMLQYVISARNPHGQILVWRLAIGFVWATALVTIVCPSGWGPGIYHTEAKLLRNQESTEANVEFVGVVAPVKDYEQKQMPIVRNAKTAGPTIDEDFASKEIGQRSVNSQSAPRLVVPLVLGVYALAVVVLLVGLVRDWVGVQHFLWNSFSTDATNQTCARQAIARVMAPGTVEVVFSNDVQVPMAVGLFNKRIVLPPAVLKEKSAADMNFVIAHECHHFLGNDLVWALLIHLTRIGLWFHPLAWRIGNSHRLACDIRCDVLAANGDVAGYSKMLASMALELGRQRETAVSMAVHTKSDTVRRLLQIGSGTNGRMKMYQKFATTLLAMSTFGVAASFGSEMINDNSTAEVVSRTEEDDFEKKSPHVVPDQATLEYFQKSEMSVANFLVQDQQGNPVENAKVKVVGLRTRLERASAHVNLYEKTCVSHTDSDGRASVDFPKYAYEEMETGQVIFVVEHPDFVLYHSQGRSVDALIDVELEGGDVFRLAGVDAKSGKRINNDIFAISPTGNRTSTWKLNDAGELVSSPVSSNANAAPAAMLVAVRHGEPALFSDLVDLHALADGDLERLQVELKPGNVFKGRLGESVPRPIRNGKVVLGIIQSLDGSLDLDSNVRWTDVRGINEDGTFEFESVPRSDFVQLFATCDGWNSKSAPPETILEWYPYVTTESHAQRMHDTILMPQVFENVSGQIAEVSMEADAELTVRVVDEDGNPIQGAQVTMSPNFAFAPGPGGIVGMYHSTLERLMQAGKNRAARRMNTGMSFPYAKATDADGIAVLNRLPGRQDLSIRCEHFEYELPPMGRNQFSRYQKVNLSPGGSKQIEITLEPKGSKVLGR